MISTCNPRIASWSADGLNFVIKDAEKFQSQVIPKYFKHNKFSSFVRQLHFYGFHKVKPETLRVDLAQAKEESKLWRFHHEHFQRDRPELLAFMQKSTSSSTKGTDSAKPEKGEVEHLRKEVSSLKNQLAGVKRELENFKIVMGEFLLHTSNNVTPDMAESSFPTKHIPTAAIPAKRLKLSEDAVDDYPSVVPADLPEPTPILESSMQVKVENSAVPDPMAFYHDDSEDVSLDQGIQAESFKSLLISRRGYCYSESRATSALDHRTASHHKPTPSPNQRIAGRTTLTFRSTPGYS